ncbi:MAG: hypothetical protein GY937_09880 [bacterium]|nr:hypothetical protein [bacterium]
MLAVCAIWNAPSAFFPASPSEALVQGPEANGFEHAATERRADRDVSNPHPHAKGPGGVRASASRAAASSAGLEGAALAAELEEAPVHRVWELRAEAPHHLDHAIGDYRPTRHGLSVDPERIRALEVGEALALPLPGLGVIDATVTWVNQASNGDRGIGAVIDGSDDEYALTLTLGERALFGQVSTAQGRFLVEGTSTVAAVFRDDLQQVLVDTNQTDERIPQEVLP